MLQLTINKKRVLKKIKELESVAVKIKRQVKTEMLVLKKIKKNF